MVNRFQTLLSNSTCAATSRLHELHAHPGGGGTDSLSRGLHSFPFPLKFSLLRPFLLNLSLLCPPCNPNIPVDVSRRRSS